MVYLNRSIPVIAFCLRVIFLAIVAGPVLVHGEEPSTLYAPPSEPTSTEKPKTEAQKTEPLSQKDSAPLVPPAIDDEVKLKEATADSAVDLESANFPIQGYWMVSSRRAVQTVHSKNSGPWHLDVHQVHSTGGSQAFNVQQLTSQLTPGIPVCIFSHGSFVTWESNSRQARQAYRKIRWASRNAPLQMIFFSWPSDGPYTFIPQVDVSVRGKRAEFNGFHLATLISHIPESCPVTVVGHSHGTRVALSAMQLAAGGTVQGHTFTKQIGHQRRLRVVLAAGAVDHNWLNPGQKYGLALNRVECLLNLINQNDLPLALYPLHRPFARRSIARAGITSRDTATLGYNAAKIRQVDVTNRVGSAHYWPDYYDDNQILATIIPYLVSY